MENKTLLIVAMTALLILMIASRFSTGLNYIKKKLIAARQSTGRLYHGVIVQERRILKFKMKSI